MHTTVIFFNNKYLTTRENNFLWPQSAKENTGENLTMYKNNQNPSFRGLFKHYLTSVKNCLDGVKSPYKTNYSQEN